jgi:hypothetical protein
LWIGVAGSAFLDDLPEVHPTEPSTHFVPVAVAARAVAAAGLAYAQNTTTPTTTPATQGQSQPMPADNSSIVTERAVRSDRN